MPKNDDITRDTVCYCSPCKKLSASPMLEVKLTHV